MPEVEPINDKFCPECGLPVEHAIMIPTGGIPPEFTAPYETSGGHAIVDETEIRIYLHGEGGGSA